MQTLSFNYVGFFTFSTAMSCEMPKNAANCVYSFVFFCITILYSGLNVARFGPKLNTLCGAIMKLLASEHRFFISMLVYDRIRSPHLHTNGSVAWRKSSRSPKSTQTRVSASAHATYGGGRVQGAFERWRGVVRAQTARVRTRATSMKATLWLFTFFSFYFVIVNCCVSWIMRLRRLHSRFIFR